jgi:DNA repair exonuclease SbcCD ATPase subunit
MRLRQLTLTQFRLFEHVEIRFEDGLCAIVGPNGAGKSTILEGVAWSLFGAGAARRSEQSLRRVGAPPDAVTVAELHFEVGGSEYRVRRTLSPGSSQHADAPGSDVHAASPGGEVHAASAGEVHADAVLSAGVARDAQPVQAAAVANAQTELGGPSGLTAGSRAYHVLATGPADVTVAMTGLLRAGRERFMHACFTGRKELHLLAQLRPTGRIGFITRLLEQELAESEERLRTLGAAPDLLAQYTAELEQLRPQLAEAVAEAQRLHEDWSQKRQDVDTKLASYSKRMDELKQQIGRLSDGGAAASCPTCERPLGTGADPLRERLDDEYYIATQDVKWLVQRQRQLTQKPPDLVAAETRRSRLRASVDDRTSRAARCEQAMQELWTVASDRKRTAERLDALQRSGPAPAAPAEAWPLSPALLRALADRAGAAVALITNGEYDAISLDSDGRVHALAGGVPTPVVSGGDEDLIALALRLATMQLVQQKEAGPGMMLLDDPFGGMDEARQRRAMELLARLNGDHPQIIVTTRSPTLGELAPIVRYVPARPARDA